MIGRMLRAGLAMLLCGVLASGGAWAQSADAGDPPSRVGRLSEIEGTVSFHSGDQDQWSPAALNYPVVAGSSFWTEPSARAALQVGPATVRLASQTEFDVVALDDHNFQGQIGQGAVHLRLYALPAGDGVQIVTARGTVQITAPGHYHIDGGTDATPTRVTVFDGAAEFVGASTTLAVHPNETAQISGAAAGPLTYDVAGAQPDELDRWATSRDDRPAIAQAPRYVSPEMTGYQDLDAYGAWSQTPSDGAVWYPASVPADWAPYRDGHWAYVEPWGWTWVDDAPWGFAPFHYGRWRRDHDRWGWYPGAVVERPVYAPALVAFVGGPPVGPRVRAGVEIGIGIGAVAAAVAWIPLGPHEAYDPPFRHGPAYVRNVNINHVTNVTNINVSNRTVNHFTNASAATVVPAAAMVGSRPVRGAAVAVPAAQLGARPVAAAPPAVRPTLATAGASPTGIRAAGGAVDPAHAHAAAPGPLAAPGRPATAVALTRVAPPAPGARPTPPHVVAASAASPPTASQATGSQASAPAAPPPAGAINRPPPGAAAPGPPIVHQGAPPRGVPVANAPRPPELAPHPAPPQPAAAPTAAPRPAQVAPHAAPPQPAAAPAAAPHPAPPPPRPAVARAPAAMPPPVVSHAAPPPHPVIDVHRAPPPQVATHAAPPPAPRPAPPPPHPAPPPPQAHAAPPPQAHPAPPAHQEHKDEHH